MFLRTLVADAGLVNLPRAVGTTWATAEGQILPMAATFTNHLESSASVGRRDGYLEMGDLRLSSADHVPAERGRDDEQQHQGHTLHKTSVQMRLADLVALDETLPDRKSP